MLGIFVIIGSSKSSYCLTPWSSTVMRSLKLDINRNCLIVIRAYFSKRNETMLTCTVSMIETMIAITAACLPRTLLSIPTLFLFVHV